MIILHIYYSKIFHELTIQINSWKIKITTHLYSTIESEMVRYERVYSILPCVFVYQTLERKEVK